MGRVSLSALRIAMTVMAAFEMGALGAGSAAAATFTVDRSDDPNPAGLMCTAAANDCSLRAAVAVANMSAGTDTVSFDSSIGAITLSHGDGSMYVTQSLGIIGGGSSKTVITQTLPDRIFHSDVPSISISLSKLRLSNGEPMTGDGGAVQIAAIGASLSLSEVRMDNNKALDGAGGAASISGASSTLSIADSYFDNNEADGGSGAGGAIHAYDTSTSIGRSSFFSNEASENGGALALVNLGADAITNVTFHGNRSDKFGGAVSSAGGPVVVRSSTFVDNVADSDGGGSGDGGAFSPGIGGVNIGNSILVRNYRSVTLASCSSLLTDSGHNLVDGANDCVNRSANGNVDATGYGSPTFGAYGGPVIETLPLTVGNPAVDAGDSALCTGISSDTRGGARVVGSACDIGAFELGAMVDVGVTTTTPTAFTSGGTGTISATLQNTGFDPAFGASVTMTVAGPLTITALTMAGGTCDLPTRTCTVTGPLNTAATAAIAATVSSGTAGVHTYSLTAASQGTDASTSDATAAGTMTVNAPTTTTTTPVTARQTGSLARSARMARNGKFSFRLGCTAGAGVRCTTTVTLRSVRKIKGRYRVIACTGSGAANSTYTVTCAVPRKVRKLITTKGSPFASTIVLRTNDGQRVSAAGRRVTVAKPA